jgi:hypothetical protein
VLRLLPICVAMVVVLMTAPAADGAGWTIQPTPNPTTPQGTLSAVSCTSTACTAVGFGPDSAGAVLTLAERWDGTAWTIQPTPNPVGAKSGSLDGVACSSMTSCVAVGHYIDSFGTTMPLSEVWDGSAWTIQPIPRPVAATGARLNGVSCTAATECTAVGSYSNLLGADLTLVERWSGSSWTIQGTPNPPGSEWVLNGVSCSTASACIAVGTLTEVWDGTSWTVRSSPSVLTSVSCTSPSACTAVGNSSSAARWNGASWTDQSTPTPAGFSFIGLQGVSCSTASTCAAVGHYTNAAGSEVTLAELWDGTAWTVQSTPNPDGAPFADLSGVSCSAPSACTAAGRGGNVTLAERWDGSSWTIQATPSPAGAAADPTSVSCSTANHCVSVGTGSFGGGGGLVGESWDGSTWTIQSMSEPAAAQTSVVMSVSCTSPSACIAVGSYVDGAGATRSLAEGWDGSTWSVQPVPEPAVAKASSLWDVSCAGATACVAVGKYVDSAGAPLTLIEEWDGASWSLLQSPNPAGARDVLLRGVSCSTAVACTAVGSYTDSAGSDWPIVEARSSSAWVIQAAPLPADATNGGALVDASCSAATACTAMGVYMSNQTFVAASFAARWDGSNWTVQSIASPVAGATVFLFGITCPSPTDCITAGYYYGPGGSANDSRTLVEAWDGTSWTVQPSENPPLAKSSGFADVSCATTTDCTAVGWSWGPTPDGNDGPSVVLAERYDPQFRAPTSLTAAPQLVIFPPPSGVGSGTLSATLRGSGLPLAGRKIAFNVSGIPLCSAVTGTTGTATCHVGFLAELIVFLANRYSASFAGDASYLASRASTPAIQLGPVRLAQQASLRARHHVSIVRGTLTRGRLRYAVLTRRRSHGVARLRFKSLRPIRRGRYTLTVRLTGGAKVSRTIPLR